MTDKVFEKIGGAYCFWLVRTFVWHDFARVLNFHIWIPYGKVADPYFFHIRVMSLSGVMPLLKIR